MWDLSFPIFPQNTASFTQKPQQQPKQMKPKVHLVMVGSSPKVGASLTELNIFLVSSSSLKVRASPAEPSSFLGNLFLIKPEKEAKGTKLPCLEATEWEKEI